ncbi:MAG: hypothetical protein ROO76_20875 [Terriglobia bacterium]|nr:hypothetical protein [Terriglobia bacterium]
MPNLLSATGKIRKQVILAAIVYTDIGIRRPYQDAINAAISSCDIVKVPPDGVLSCLRIVEEPIMDHHLRLHEVRLRPTEFGALILVVVVSNSDESFSSPVP